MGLEVAPFISDLTPTWPLSTDKVREGDDHLRLIKAAVRGSFPNINSEVTATPEILNAIPANLADIITQLIDNICPQGTICAFSGLIEDIPVTWVLCNGANGSPNLQGHFIKGAGGGFVEGDTGTLVAGDGTPDDPPFMILCYIMKVATYVAP